MLSGPTASLSGSNKPERWFRSTLTEIVDNDPIQVGASANSSAAYKYAVPFQKDLLLFADKYQALIPSGNTALTPRNATVVITSNFESDLGAQTYQPRPYSHVRTAAKLCVLRDVGDAA